MYLHYKHHFFWHALVYYPLEQLLQIRSSGLLQTLESSGPCRSHLCLSHKNNNFHRGGFTKRPLLWARKFYWMPSVAAFSFVVATAEGMCRHILLQISCHWQGRDQLITVPASSFLIGSLHNPFKEVPMEINTAQNTIGRFINSVVRWTTSLGENGANLSNGVNGIINWMQLARPVRRFSLIHTTLMDGIYSN